MDHDKSPLAVLIGRRIRKRRINGDLSEVAVARALDMDIKSYQAAEAGNAHFTAEDLYNLCSILRVRVSWFFDEMSS